jgi:hypothetical protein
MTARSMTALTTAIGVLTHKVPPSAARAAEARLDREHKEAEVDLSAASLPDRLHRCPRWRLYSGLGMARGRAARRRRDDKVSARGAAAWPCMRGATPAAEATAVAGSGRSILQKISNLRGLCAKILDAYF